MKTASIGRRFGDWLGVVPEDEAAPTVVTATAGNAASPGDHGERKAETAPAPVPPDRVVMSFRDVVNQRRGLGG